MSEYVKESSNAKGWKVVSYESKGRKESRKATDSDGAPLTADGMDEAGTSEREGEEGPDAMLSVRARL